MRDISCGRTKKGEEIFSSERFCWVLFGGRRPQELTPLNANPLTALSKLIQRTLPQYSEVVTRYPVVDLLRDSNRIADGAYVRAVWAYSAALGKDTFPDGVYEWPPPQDSAASSSAVLRAAQGGNAASSSSSAAPHHHATSSTRACGQQRSQDKRTLDKSTIRRRCSEIWRSLPSSVAAASAGHPPVPPPVPPPTSTPAPAALNTNAG